MWPPDYDFGCALGAHPRTGSGWSGGSSGSIPEETPNPSGVSMMIFISNPRFKKNIKRKIEAKHHNKYSLEIGQVSKSPRR